MTVIARSADNPLPAVRSAVQSIDDALPLNDPSRLDQAVEHDVWFLRLISKIFITFGAIALLMACGGIYAVIAHATSSRTQEIGVRIALGADLRDILLLFMARGLWQIGGGLILGLVAAAPRTFHVFVANRNFSFRACCRLCEVYIQLCGSLRLLDTRTSRYVARPGESDPLRMTLA